MKKRIIYNNYIKAAKVRLIDQNGKQLGIVGFDEAGEMAANAGLDLIQVTEKVDPPVCKIMDYGKYLYHLEKREQKVKPQHAGELKNIRLSFNISPHDLETRAKAAEKFMKKGYKIRLDMVLRGREKGLNEFAKQKVRQFLDFLQKAGINIKTERELKMEMRGLTMIISKI